MNFFNKFKYARDSYLITILIVAIIVMINYIAANHFVKIDLTKNKIYAVSDASKTIIKDLDDIVTVKVFFSEKLPPNLFAVRQYIGDILDEFSSYSKGNISVKFLKPSNPEVKKEALKLKIPQVQMNIVEKDKSEVINGFLGIAIGYGDKVEILPIVKNVLNVEYNLISAIKKVTASTEMTVAFTEGHGEPSLTASSNTIQSQRDSFSLLKKGLSQNYKVISADLTDENPLKNINTLLIAGPKKEFSDKEKKAIDKFVVNGGNLVIFMDAIEIDEELKASSSKTNLDGLLKHYGVVIEDKFILDKSNEKATSSNGYMNYIIPYPFWIKAINTYFDKQNPIVANLNSIILPWSSPVKIIKNKGVKSTILVNSSENAWLQAEPFNLNPGAVQSATSYSKYPLVALLEGKFKSYFSENESLKTLKTGRILVVGNSRFITDRFVGSYGYGQNMIFAMNAVDFLTLDESLINIRSKLFYDLPLKNLKENDRNIIKFTGILLIPILVIIYGIMRFFARRRKKTGIYF